MGFTSRDNWIKNQTNLGVSTALQTVHAEWNKYTYGTAYTTGRWYDLNLCYGTPPYCQYGELTLNAGPWNSANSWQTNTQWTYTVSSPTGSFVRAGTGTGALTQTAMQSSLINGRTYTVIWNLTAVTVGSITVSLNGASGTARSVAGTYVETITVGAGTGGLSFNASGATVTATIAGSATIPTGVSVFETLQSFPLSDTNAVSGALYHGGNVSPLTKHIFNVGVTSAVATFVPGILILCDFLMAYPGIDMNSMVTQTLINTNSLPRYTTGAGTRMCLVMTNTYPATLGIYAGSPTISFTNQDNVSGKTPPVAIDDTVGSIIGQLVTTGLNENNYGPFIPVPEGDTGIRSVQSITLSSATDNPYRVFPNTIALASLVLVRPLLNIPITQATVMSERDLMFQLPALPQVVDGAFLGWLYFAGAATAANSGINGYIDVSWA